MRLRTIRRRISRRRLRGWRWRCELPRNALSLRGRRSCGIASKSCANASYRSCRTGFQSPVNPVKIRSNQDEIQSFLTDASFIREGHADRLVFPESVEEVAEIVAGANRDRVPVTVSGAGTGTVGGRVAFGGIVLATDRLNRIKSIVH